MTLAAVIERSKKDREGWKYTSLAPLAVQKFAAAAPKAPDQILPSIVGEAKERHQIVFANGVLQKERSKLGELEGILKGDAKQGYKLALAGQTCLVTAPVELVFLADSDKPAEFDFRLTVELGANGRLTLIEHYVKAAGAAPIAAIHETDIHLGQQAKLVHGRVIDGHGEQSLLSRMRVQAGEGAYYDNFMLIAGGKLVRNEIEVTLAEKLAQCTLNGAMLLRGSLHADTTTHIHHNAPFCSSRQIYKSVVDGKAHGVFQGKITVAEGAQKTDAQQLNRALLLSDQAEMNAKPELKIYADDVKCSHGASVGALDESAMFYLRARGIDENEARGLLIRGFVNEIIDDIQMPAWRDYCHARAEEWCDGK